MICLSVSPFTASVICDSRGARARPIAPSPCPSSVGGRDSQENQADKSVSGGGREERGR